MVKTNKLYLLIAGVLFYSCSNKTDNQSQKTSKPAVVVETVVVEETLFNYTNTYSGSLLANEVVDLRPETSGRIIGIYFTEGSAVTKNQLLVKLNDNELQAQLKKINAQLELLQDDELRRKELLKINGISKEEYDISANKLKTAQAEKEYLLAQIQKTEIRAPFNGVVGLRSVSEGAFVTNTVIIASVQQLNPMRIEFSVPETRSGSLQKNSAVSIYGENIKGALQAKIYAIEPQIDPSTRTLKIRATCPNPDNKLIPGAFVRVGISSGAANNALLVPAKCIVPTIKGDMVWIVKNGKAKSQDVEAGIRTDSVVEITNGLKIGDTVISSGLLQVKKGSVVKIVKSAK